MGSLVQHWSAIFYFTIYVGIPVIDRSFPPPSVQDTARKKGRALAAYHKHIEEITPRTAILAFSEVQEQQCQRIQIRWIRNPYF